MRYIQKTQLPNELQKKLTNALRKNISWDDFSKGKAELRTHLVTEQSGLCAYSEISLTELGFHIEHIKPKGLSQYAYLRFDANNLLASAPENQEKVNGSNMFGGHKKDNRYRPQLFISPTETDCASYFQYLPNGDIQPKDGLNNHDKKRANETIQCLGLQCRLLKNKRRELFNSMNAQLKYLIDQRDAMEEFIKDYFTVDLKGKLKPFQSMIKQIYDA